MHSSRGTLRGTFSTNNRKVYGTGQLLPHVRFLHTYTPYCLLACLLDSPAEMGRLDGRLHVLLVGVLLLRAPLDQLEVGGEVGHVERLDGPAPQNART